MLDGGSAFDGLSAMLGRDVAIKGTRFAGERRAPFVVATRVNLIDSAEDGSPWQAAALPVGFIGGD